MSVAATDPSQTHRLNQIASMADAEPLGSFYYWVHVGLMVFGSFVGLYSFEILWPIPLIASYVAVLTLEKATASRARHFARADLYVPLLLLLLLRATIYNLLVVALWSTDADVFKLAALALLIASTINIFVFHATHTEIIACVVLPIWLALGAIAWLVFLDEGMTRAGGAAGIVFVSVSFYFFLALVQAREAWTAHQQAQNALLQAQKQEALGKLVSGVAHDFNNILAVILGNAEMIDRVAGDKKDELAAEIVKSAERGATLAAQLLTFGRRSQLSPEPCEIATVFGNLRAMLDRVLPETIATTFAIAPGTRAVLADRNQLETALLNLAINAKDALPEGGVISVSAQTLRGPAAARALPPGHPIRGDVTAIRIADNGVGMPEAIHGAVFDPFFTTKTVGQGAGLGLSMVMGFATQSEGAVRLDSDEGRGTTVTLFLPAAPGTASEAPEPEPATPAVAVRKGSVLLVEDEPPLREVLRRLLEAHGHRVTVAQNGREALDLLGQGWRPDVMITDLVMPGTPQGLELARIARARLPGLPVIAMSGYPEGAMVSQRRDGTTPPEIRTEDVLRKPIREDTLLRAIDAALAGTA